ncbi:hypothetical protein FACS189499_06630 [Clostridia bacterium]|nr:hypothetical protein FACS189499_06630 [Clostridia bacterium]
MIKHKLYIKWDSGHFAIRDVNDFFPITLEHFRKFLKVVDLDYEHSEEIYKRLGAFFRKKLKELAILHIAWEQQHADYIADVEKLTEINDSMSKEVKEKLRAAKQNVKYAREGRKKNERDTVSYERYLKILEQRK